MKLEEYKKRPHFTTKQADFISFPFVNQLALKTKSESLYLQGLMFLWVKLTPYEVVV